jgi:hypothetical protein
VGHPTGQGGIEDSAACSDFIPAAAGHRADTGHIQTQKPEKTHWFQKRTGWHGL